MEHALISCPMAASIWALAPDDLMQAMSERQEDRAKDWLFAIHKMLPTDLFERLIVTLWAIWYARRKFKHEALHKSPL